MTNAELCAMEHRRDGVTPEAEAGNAKQKQHQKELCGLVTPKKEAADDAAAAAELAAHYEGEKRAAGEALKAPAGGTETPPEDASDQSAPTPTATVMVGGPDRGPDAPNAPNTPEVDSNGAPVTSALHLRKDRAEDQQVGNDDNLLQQQQQQPSSNAETVTTATFSDGADADADAEEKQEEPLPVPLQQQRRTGKRKAAQIAKERVAGQLASEAGNGVAANGAAKSTNGHPIPGSTLQKQQHQQQADRSLAFVVGSPPKVLRRASAESPRAVVNNSSSSPFAPKREPADNGVGVGVDQAKAFPGGRSPGSSSWGAKTKRQAAQRLETQPPHYAEPPPAYEEEDDEETEEDSDGWEEFEGPLLAQKLSQTYRSLSRKTPKVKVTKNWVALVTAVEKELHGNSMKFRAKKSGKTKPRSASAGGFGSQRDAPKAAKVKSAAPAIKSAAPAVEAGAGEMGIGTSHSFLVKKVAGICCHHCQRGKELVRCSRSGCRLHYCTECLRRCYPGLTIEECRDKCPRCMGICNCKYALRMDKRCNKVPKEIGLMPGYGPQAKKEFLLNIWKNIFTRQNFVSAILEDETYELRVEGLLQGRQVTMESLPALQDNGYRVLCSKCNTTVINVLRTCNSCGYDLCPQCCIEMRGVTDTSKDAPLGGEAKQDLCCPCQPAGEGNGFCGKRLELMRLHHLPQDRMAALLSTVETMKGGPKALPNGAAMAGVKAEAEAEPAPAPAGVKEEGRDAKAAGGAPEVLRSTSDFLGTAEGVKHFQEHWGKGSPFVVSDVRGKMLWTPHLMKRAATEKRKGEYTTDVIDCAGHQVIEVSIEAFFNGYTGETQFEGNPMYKLKDWPTEEAFKDKLKRLFYDFVDMLPLKEYTHPTAGPMNLASKVPEAVTYKPDMGPKCYIAYGRKEEQQATGNFLQMDGDSVTKLHLDVADAINVMVHSTGSGEEEGGALWHIFRREDTEKLRSFLFRHKKRFVHNHCRKEVSQVNLTHQTVDPVLDQIFYLSTKALDLLKEEEGVVPWTVVQKRNDAVMVPAGCAHQVRNLGSSIKVAMDFLSPESVPEVLSLAEAHRKLPVSHFARRDQVMARLMILNSAWECLDLGSALVAGKE